MRIQIKTIKRMKAPWESSGPEYLITYEWDQPNPQYCCEQMRRAVEQNEIRFLDPRYPKHEELEGLFLIGFGSDEFYYGPAEVRIQFCPYCAENILYDDGGTLRREWEMKETKELREDAYKPVDKPE